MILCLCHGVPDHAVQDAIAAGAASVDQIRDVCGAGGDCNACWALLEALVERTTIAAPPQSTDVLTGAS